MRINSLNDVLETSLVHICSSGYDDQREVTDMCRNILKSRFHLCIFAIGVLGIGYEKSIYVV